MGEFKLLSPVLTTVGDQDNNLKSQNPPQTLGLSEARTAKWGKGDPNFRFTDDQRAYFEAEVARNGPFPSTERREEIAAQLGVHPNSVRVRYFYMQWKLNVCVDIFQNWFNHYRAESYRVKKSRDTSGNEEAPMFTGKSTSTFKDYGNFRVIELSLPQSDSKQKKDSSKRSPTSLGDGTPSDMAPAKRTRLGERLDQDPTKQAQFNGMTIQPDNMNVSQELLTQRLLY